MNAKRNATVKESKTSISTAALMRLAGVSAMLAGLSIIVMGMFHPENEPAFVTTPVWIIVHIFATSLGFFGVLGLAGLYARQVERAGWLGLIGFILFSGWMALQMPFSFLEAAILPRMATTFPPFVSSVMAMFKGTPMQVDLGVLPTIWTISTPIFVVGALLFAIATFRARLLPRWAAGLLALGCVMVPFSALVPADLAAKIILIPMGLGLAWMGYALLTERREKSADVTQDQRAAQPQASKVA
jgi:hypothetical protein